LLHLAELGRPGDIRGLAGRRHAEQPRMVDEKVDVWEILGRLDQVARMIVVLDGTEGESLVHAEAPYPKRASLFEHRVSDPLVVDKPATIKPFGSSPGVRLPGVDLEGGRLQVHEVEIGLAELWRDEAMGEHPAGLCDAVDLVADMGHFL